MYRDIKEVAKDIQAHAGAPMEKYRFQALAPEINQAANRTSWTQTLQGSSNAWVNAFQISSIPAQAFNIFGSNKSSSVVYYLQVYDLQVSAVSGAKDWSLVNVVQVQDNFYFDFNVHPWKFSRGIYVAASTSSTQLTLGDSDIWLNWQILNETPA